MAISFARGENFSPWMLLQETTSFCIIFLLSGYLALQQLGIARSLQHFSNETHWQVITVGICSVLAVLYKNRVLQFLGCVGLALFFPIIINNYDLENVIYYDHAALFSVLLLMLALSAIACTLRGIAHATISLAHRVYVISSIPVVSVGLVDVFLRTMTPASTIDILITVATIVVTIRFVVASMNLYFLFLELLMRIIMLIPYVMFVLKGFAAGSLFELRFSNIFFLCCAGVAFVSLAYTINGLSGTGKHERQ